MIGFLRRLSGWARRAGYFPPDLVSGGFSTWAGPKVSADAALRIAAVLSCVKVISETVAGLPLHVYERSGTGRRRKEIARRHPLYRILHSETNGKAGMTSFAFREVMQAWLLLYGNAFALIERKRNGTIVSLRPWHPVSMDARFVNGTPTYRLLTSTGEHKPWPSENVLHMRALALDSNAFLGMSPIKYARESLGLSLAAQEYGAQFFGRSARPSGVLEYDSYFKDQEDAQRFMDQWNAAYQGSGKAGKTALLERGIKWKALSLPPEDAQFLETRKYQRAEIAAIFRVPPHKIGDLERATHSNVEQQNIEFGSDTIYPWVVRWEQELQRALFTEREKDIYFAGFVMDGLLRPDTATRYAAYATAIQNGIQTPNEVRDLENLNPIPGGDGLFMQMNMVALQEAGDGGETPANDGDADTREGRRGLGAEGNGDGGQDLQDRQDGAAVERRAASSAYRVALRGKWLGKFHEVGGKLVRAEVQEIRKVLDDKLKRSPDVFGVWLDEFYQEPFAEMAKRIMGPLFGTYGEAMGTAAELEIGADLDDGFDLVSVLMDYLGGFTNRHAASSRGQLGQLLRGEGAGATDEDGEPLDPAEAIERRLDEWEERRPGKIGDRECVELGDAVAKAVFVRAGVRLLRWVANAGACSFCEELNGIVVGVAEAFVTGGGSVSPEGEEAMSVAGNVGHAPLHEGCQCTVEAG